MTNLCDGFPLFHLPQPLVGPTKVGTSPRDGKKDFVMINGGKERDSAGNKPKMGPLKAKTEYDDVCPNDGASCPSTMQQSGMKTNVGSDCCDKTGIRVPSAALEESPSLPMLKSDQYNTLMQTLSESSTQRTDTESLIEGFDPGPSGVEQGVLAQPASVEQSTPNMGTNREGDDYPNIAIRAKPLTKIWRGPKGKFRELGGKGTGLKAESSHNGVGVRDILSKIALPDGCMSAIAEAIQQRSQDQSTPGVTNSPDLKSPTTYDNNETYDVDDVHDETELKLPGAEPKSLKGAKRRKARIAKAKAARELTQPQDWAYDVKTEGVDDEFPDFLFHLKEENIRCAMDDILAEQLHLIREQSSHDSVFNEPQGITKDSQRQKKYREKMTPEKRKVYLESQAARMRRSRATMSPSRLEKVRATNAAHRRKVRAEMTEEERQSYRAACAAYQRKSRATMSPTRKKQIREANAARKRKARSSMTPEELEAARAASAAYMRKSRASMSPTRKKQYLEQQAARMRRIRADRAKTKQLVTPDAIPTDMNNQSDLKLIDDER